MQHNPKTPPEYEHVESLADVDGDVLVANASRSRRDVVHLPDPDDPTEPLCRTPIETGTWTARDVEKVPRSKRLCHYCNPVRTAGAIAGQKCRTTLDVLKETGHFDEVERRTGGESA